jgi:hypothetical protein
MKIPGFIGPSAVSSSLQASCERTRNFYLEPLPRSAKNQAALYPTPGFTTFSTVSTVSARALYEMNEICLGVVGSTAYNIISTGAATSIGTVAQDGHQAQIASNGAVGGQFLFASGTNGYCYTTATSAFTQVLTGNCVQIGVLDGYGIALDPTISKIRLSNLNDLTTWDPTQFAQRGDAPDNWVAMVVNIPDIWLIGEQTGVVWYDAGAFPFPFAQRPGATFKYGIRAPWTLKSAGGTVIWLSHNAEGEGIVVQAVGYSPQRISTPELESEIAKFSETVGIGDAEAMMFQYQGHTFYALTFPAARATRVYDLTTGVWVDWGKWLPAQTMYDIWAPRVHAHAFGKHLVGDRTTGTISFLDSTSSLESDGSVIRRERITPALFNENRQLSIRKTEIFIESGLGTISGAGSDPILTMATSDDGGHTFLPERRGSAGKIGEYMKRIQFWRGGLPRNRVHKIVVSDPIPWRLIDGFINNDGPQANEKRG